jgi:schlafen family protein
LDGFRRYAINVYVRIHSLCRETSYNSVMAPGSVGGILEESESEEFEKKSRLDPSNPRDMLGLVADIVAMANTRGGRLLIGTSGIAVSEGDLKLFDSARLDDKVNAYVEPNIGGIKVVILDESLLVVQVEKSKNPPHIFKKEGNYNDPEKGQQYIFRARDIFVRHSSKTERATRSDLDRMFSERQQTLFEKVKMVFEAPAEARVQVVEGLGVPVRIDPTAPDARPMYDVLTPDPFRNLQQELIGSVKSWKTSHQLLNEAQIMKAYLEREHIQDREVIDLLLRSCWERRIPGFWWGARLGPGALPRILWETIGEAAYPSALEALKVASLLPRGLATKFFRLAQECERKSIRGKARKFEPVLRARSRKYEKLIEILYPWQKLTYIVPGGTRTVEFQKVDESILNQIIESILSGTKENRGTFKAAEAILYASKVSELPFAEDSIIGESAELSPAE